MSTATAHPIPDQRTTPTAAVTDGTMPLLRAARRQVVVDVLAAAVLDLLLAEGARAQRGESDATY